MGESRGFCAKMYLHTDPPETLSFRPKQDVFCPAKQRKLQVSGCPGELQVSPLRAARSGRDDRVWGGREVDANQMD